MKKNYFYSLILSITNILFPILSFPYASRILGPVGIGKVQLTITFSQYFGLFAAFGIPVYGMQQIAKYRNNESALSKTYSELMSINIITSIFITLLYLIIISVFPFFENGYNLYIISSIIVFLGFTSIDWAYSGLEEFKIITIRSVIIKSLSLFLLYLLVKKESDYIYFLLINIFSLLGNNFISLFYFRKKVKFVYREINLIKHLRPLFFIFASTIAASMYTYLDTILLGFLTNEKSVGYYTAAIKLTKISIPLITAAGVVFIPKFAIELNAENKENIQKLLNHSWHYIVFFSVPIFIGLFVFSEEFILLLSGAEFSDAIITMKILSSLPLIIGLGYFFGFQILIPMGKNKEMFYSVISGMIISLILNFYLINIFKENGTALASVITELFVTSFYLYYVNKNFNYTYDWKLIIKCFTSCVLFFPISLLLTKINLALAYELIISIILSAVSYFAIQFLIFKDKFILEYISVIRNKFIKL